jgi:hypothetical protein
MKFLKIVMIVLISSIGFVACEKHECKPEGKDDAKETNTTVNKTNKGNTNNSNSSINRTSTNLEIVGSGDDDRDGGDKKKKLVK